MELVPAAKMLEDLPYDWDTTVKALIEARDNLAGGILKYRWVTGKFALEVAAGRGKPEQDRRFGIHNFHDIAVELGESESTVRACMRFHAQTSPEQLEHMISEGWAWRAACALVTVEDPKARRRLQLDYEAGKYDNSDAFKEKVKATKEEANLVRSRKKVEKDKKAKPSFGGRNIRSQIAGFNTVSGALMRDAIPQLLEGLNRYRERHENLAPVTAEHIVDQIAAANDNVDVLFKRLGDVRAAIHKLGVLGARAKAEGKA